MTTILTRLFFLSRPATVLWRVIAVAVDAVKSHRSVRSITHVGQKVLKRCPSSTELYAFLEVVGAFGVSTSMFHGDPRFVSDAFPLPMLGDQMPRTRSEVQATSDAAAAYCFTRSHVGAANNSVPSAFTSTLPSSVTVLALRWFDGGQHPEGFTDHVGFLHEAIISCNRSGPKVGVQ